MRIGTAVLLLLLTTYAAHGQDPFGPVIEPTTPDEEPREKPEEESAARGPRLQFDLVDGSRIIGTPVTAKQSLTMRSHVGTFEVPLKDLASFTVSSDHETTILQWPNGDRLTGFVDGDGVEIETVLGKLLVRHPAVARCTVLGGARAVPFHDARK